jgi:hypothetical protein
MLWHLIQPVKSDKVNLRIEHHIILSIVKGKSDLGTRSFVGGSALLFLFIASAAGIFWGWPAWAAAEVSEPVEYGQYLPLILQTGCIPVPIIEPDDPGKDIAVEAGINLIREGNGSPVLVHAAELTQAALRHSNDMAGNIFVSHTGSDGSGVGQRLEDACYKWRAHGEIIAAGYETPGEVIAGWKKSSAHMNIILSEMFAEFGAGYAYNAIGDDHYWTVDFGLRATEYLSTTGGYYSCTYYMGDENGESWLSIYSVTPCRNVTELPTGSIGLR